MNHAPLNSARIAKLTLLAMVLLAFTIFIMTTIGSSSQTWFQALRGEEPARQIMLGFRLSRVLLAGLAGGALAVAGLLFQTLVRDALADPYTLGVSSGGSLGAVLAIVFGWREVAGLPAMAASSFAGSAIVMLVVLVLASKGRRLSSFTLLLSGITINSICMALVLFLHNLSNYGDLFAIDRWLMGGIDSMDYTSLAALAALLLIVVGFVFSKARQWNLLAVGEDWVEARGIAVQPLILSGFLAGSLLTASVTSCVGPIGFVGLLVPHALRLRFGADHRVLIPVAFFAGAIFLIICDTAARTLLSPTAIPVGVITALLGGPFFLYLLSSRRGSLWA
jgi:iron complex transport system permease protein